MWYIYGLLLTGVISICSVTFITAYNNMQWTTNNKELTREDALGWILLAAGVSLTWPVGLPAVASYIVGGWIRDFLTYRKQRKEDRQREYDQERIPDLT